MAMGAVLTLSRSRAERVREERTRPQHKACQVRGAVVTFLMHVQTKAEFEAKLNAGDGGYTDLQDWGEKVERITKEIEQKEMRWLELAEMV